MTQQEIKHTHEKQGNNRNKQTKKQTKPKQTSKPSKQNFGIQGTLAHFNMNSSYEKYKATQP